MAKSADGKTTETSKSKINKKKGRLSPILTILLVLVILVAVFGGVFYFIVKNNLGGVTEKNYATLKKIPVLNLALPEAPDPFNTLYMTESEIKKQYNIFKAENETLKKTLADTQAQNSEYKVFKDDNDVLTQEAENKMKELDIREKAVAEKELQLKDLQQKIDELIVNGDKEAFKTYYEGLDPENAKLIYEQIIKEVQINAEVKKFAGVYAEMDAAAAAQIFEQLGTSKLDMTVETLKAMNKESSAKILESMTPDFAAKVTERLNALYKGN